MKKIIAAFGVVCILGIINISNAQTPRGGVGAPGSPTPQAGVGAPAQAGGTRAGLTVIEDLPLVDPLGEGTTIEGLLQRIINWLILMAAPIAAGMVVYGAYQMLFAAGEPEKIKTGRNTILYTVIGYGIILISWGVVSIVENFLRGG